MEGALADKRSEAEIWRTNFQRYKDKEELIEGDWR